MRNQPNHLTIQQIHDIRAYYDSHHNHDMTCKVFGITYAQEHAINKIGRDYHVSEQDLATRMKDMDANESDPDMIALAVLDDTQYIAYMERRYNAH